MEPKDFIGLVSNGLRKDAEKAASDNRLFFMVGDQYGRPCNGGTRQDSPIVLGKWSPEIEHIKICSSGYHVTIDPIRWIGCTLWLAELSSVADRSDDKVVGPMRRAIAQIFPWQCKDDDLRLFVATSRPFLKGAILKGANLEGASYNAYTKFPRGFDLEDRGMIKA